MEREHSQPSSEDLELDIGIAGLSIEDVKTWEKLNPGECAVVYSTENRCHYINPCLIEDLRDDVLDAKSAVEDIERLMRSVADREPRLTLGEFLSNRAEYQEEYDRAKFNKLMELVTKRAQ